MQNKSAFTLVELIVVITILAILGTIAFISLQGYSSTARNSKRVSDIVNVGKGLEIKKIKSGFYEFPENYETFTGTLTKTLKQGILGDKVLTNIGVTTNVKDPITEDNYTYSVYGEGEYYQIAYELENNIFSSNLNILNTINAEDTTKAVKIKGNYEMDPSLPSLIVIPETVTGSGIFDPEVCFILEGGENTFESTSIDCQKKKEMTLKNFDEGLVGYWDMETLTGTLLKDLSGNENNGSFEGAMTYSNALTGGILSKGLFFNGNLNNIKILNSSSLNPEEITIQVVINSYGTGTNSNDYPRILAKGTNSGNSEQYAIWLAYNTLYPNGNISQFRLNTETRTAVTGYINKNLNPYLNVKNKSIYLTFTYTKNGVGKIYINGVYFGEDKTTFNGKILSSTIDLIIGNGSGVIGLTRAYYGIIDDIKIYNRILSDQEIKQQAKIAGF